MLHNVLLVGLVALLGAPLAQGYGDVDTIPGLTRDKYGTLLFNGEEVVSISGIGDGPEEVVNLEEVASYSPVDNVEEVVGKAEVNRLQSVYNKLPVISKQEISRLQELANMREVVDMQEVDAKEVVGMDEVLNMEEVINMQPVRAKEVPEDVVQEFYAWQQEGDSGHLRDQVDRISSMLEVKRKELVVAQEELRSMLRVIKKLELSYVAEIEEMEEVTRMQELENLREIKKLREVTAMEEVTSMQEVKAQEVEATELKNVQEIKSMQELNPREVAKLKSLMAKRYDAGY